jgi:hypothetical protein
VRRSPFPAQPDDFTGNVPGEPNEVMGMTPGALSFESAVAAALGHFASHP